MKKYSREDIYRPARELSNHGRWDDDDQIGTLNNISFEDIVDAGRL